MAGLAVRILGSGDAFGSGGRLQTCIMVEAPATRFLIDCGASSLIAIKRAGVDPNSIDAVMITHLHGDHFGGLPFLVLDAQLVSRRTRPLIVAGPPGLVERVIQAMEVFFPGSSSVSRKFALELVELQPGQRREVGFAGVTPYEVVHPCGAPAFALRVDCAGKTICYSGDTEWTESLVTAAAGVDLFIAEAYFFEKAVKYHLDYKTLRGQLGRIRPKRVILTHMSRDMLDHVDEVDCEHAEDGKLVTL
ncbi:MAG: MBL fold metallo-hydrolase [Alphaproteobacteria bacterium]|nr:MBL fold metallo-hydrolase [Alphaproteobacteria bacterium]